MKFDQAYGLVVIPIGKDGKPRMNALWCATHEEAWAAYYQWRPAYQPMIAYRVTPTEQEESCPQKSSSDT